MSRAATVATILIIILLRDRSRAMTKRFILGLSTAQEQFGFALTSQLPSGPSPLPRARGKMCGEQNGTKCSNPCHSPRVHICEACFLPEHGHTRRKNHGMPSKGHLIPIKVVLHSCKIVLQLCYVHFLTNKKQCVRSFNTGLTDGFKWVNLVISFAVSSVILVRPWTIRTSLIIYF